MAMSKHAKDQGNSHLQCTVQTDLMPTFANLKSKFPEPIESDQYLNELWPEIHKYESTVMPRFPVSNTWEETEVNTDSYSRGQDDMSPRNSREGPTGRQLSVGSVVFKTGCMEHHSTSVLDILEHGFGENPLEDNTLDHLRQLKYHLLRYNASLHRVLFYYTYLKNALGLPSIGDIKVAIDTIANLLLSMDIDSLLWQFQHAVEIPITRDNIICSILGLNDAHTEQFMNIDDEEREHQSDRYLIQQMLEDKLWDLMQSNPDKDYSEPTEDNLIELGFRESRAKLLVEMLGNSPLRLHHSLIYWAKKSIRDSFEYDILLCKHAVGLPESMADTNRMLCFDHQGDDEYQSASRLSNVNYIFTPTPYECLNIFDVGEHEEPSLYLYHGTDFNSAMHIVNNGIQLRKGNTNLNFSDGFGFYLTDDHCAAVNWAKSTHFSPHCVVLAFKIPLWVFEEYTCFDLLLRDVELQQWRDVIAYNRTGRDRSLFNPPAETRQKYHAADYVEGPTCMNGGQFEISRNVDLVPGEFKELCVLSQDMANNIGNPDNITMCVFER